MSRGNSVRSPKADRKAVEMAIGRIFRIMSRPYKKGDEEQYEEARNVVMSILGDRGEYFTVNYARDRNKGAAGD